MAVKIEAWKASDGSLHDHREDADEHDAKLSLARAFRDVDELAGDYSEHGEIDLGAMFADTAAPEILGAWVDAARILARHCPRPGVAERVAAIKAKARGEP